MPKRVDVYWNLHKHLFSVRDRVNGRVAFHTADVVLSHGQFVVGEKGRQRVLREKRKNVHAMARGDYFSEGAHDTMWALEWAQRPTNLRGVLVTYNPYRGGHFFEVETGAIVTEWEWCIMSTEELGGNKAKPVMWAVWKNLETRFRAIKLALAAAERFIAFYEADEGIMSEVDKGALRYHHQAKLACWRALDAIYAQNAGLKP